MPLRATAGTRVPSSLKSRTNKHCSSCKFGKVKHCHLCHVTCHVHETISCKKVLQENRRLLPKINDVITTTFYHRLKYFRTQPKKYLFITQKKKKKTQYSERQPKWRVLDHRE
jgi:hypothetical protein